MSPYEYKKKGEKCNKGKKCGGACKEKKKFNHEMEDKVFSII